jgi:TolB-like protein/AraC-like DNA-binding protein
MQKEFIQKLTNIVEANLANDKFGTDELAKEAGMSRSNLNRKLKIITNQNSSQFIREIRLKKAKELLLNEDATAAEISYRVGFGSPTYFNKCFHEYFGHAPGEMRNNEPEIETKEQPVEILPKKSKQTKILIGFVASLIVLLPLAFFLITKYSVFKPVDAKEKSIAVLPFKYMSNDTPNQHLADGMMEAIHQNLSKIKDLRVISSTSVEQYRKSDKTARDIGRELDVAYILEGSFQKVDNQFRLIVQLIRTKDEDHVWSNKYDRNWQDIFEIQSEVAEKVANELQAVITPEEKQLIRKVPTINLTAYDFYQKGIEEVNKYSYMGFGNKTLLKEPERLFKKALELDSTFALSYSGLATIYFHLNLGKDICSENYLDSILILTNKALSFDNQIGDAYRLRGNYYAEMGKPELALKEYYKVLKIFPNDWKAYNNICAIYKNTFHDFVGAFSTIQELILRCRGPELPKVLNLLGNSYQNVGFIEKAKECYCESFILTNDSFIYFNNNFWLMYEVGDYEGAFLEDKRTGPSNPLWGGNLLLSILSGHDEESYIYVLNTIKWLKNHPVTHPNDSHRIGYGLLQGGKQEEANYYFNIQIEIGMKNIEFGRLNSSNPGGYYDLAAAFAMKGDKDKAYQYLDEFNKKKSFPLWWVNLIKHDPLFNSLRDEPRFQKIVKDVEAKYQAEHDRVGKWLEEQGD